MLAKLEQSFRTQGDTNIKFYISFLDDNPRPDTTAIQALNEGASRIIVSEVFLTISNFTAKGENRCPHALKRTIVDSTNKKSVIGNHSRGIFAKTIYLPT